MASTDSAPGNACVPDANGLECDSGDADGDGTPNGTDPDDADPCSPSTIGTGCDTRGDDAGVNNGDNNGASNGGNGDNRGGVEDAGTGDVDAGDGGTEDSGGDSACTTVVGRSGSLSSALWLSALALVGMGRRRSRRAA